MRTPAIDCPACKRSPCGGDGCLFIATHAQEVGLDRERQRRIRSELKRFIQFDTGLLEIAVTLRGSIADAIPR